jgi:hypothetical protein
MANYWMINSRSQRAIGPNVSTDGLTHWISDKQALNDIKDWRKVTVANFQKLVAPRRMNFRGIGP